MSKTLFVQFYTNYNNILVLCNGFADTYNLCKSHGDFYWVDQDAKNQDLPISEGTIFVSVLWSEQMNQVFKWALAYPNINFIMGGPGVLSRYSLEGDRPNNLEITMKSVEEYFGVPNFSEEWRFSLPDHLNADIVNHPIILTSYTLDTSCYHRQCTFCNYHFEQIRKRKNRNDFAGIKRFIEEYPDTRKLLRLNTPCVTPFHIDNFLPYLPVVKNIRYDTLMRCDDFINDSLEKMFRTWKNRPEFLWRLGVEFPTKRMLLRMNKKFTPESILRTVRLLTEEGFITTLNFMLGWPDLVEEDIDELDNFLSTLPRDIYSIAVHKVFAKNFTDVHEEWQNIGGWDKHYVGPFYKGYFPELSDKMMELNKRAGEILLNHFDETYDFTDGLIDKEPKIKTNNFNDHLNIVRPWKNPMEAL